VKKSFYHLLFQPIRATIPVLRAELQDKLEDDYVLRKPRLPYEPSYPRMCKYGYDDYEIRRRVLDTATKCYLPSMTDNACRNCMSSVYLDSFLLILIDSYQNSETN
jgi:hypothetical protein